MVHSSLPCALAGCHCSRHLHSLPETPISNSTTEKKKRVASPRSLISQPPTLSFSPPTLGFPWVPCLAGFAGFAGFLGLDRKPPTPFSPSSRETPHPPWSSTKHEARGGATQSFPSPGILLRTATQGGFIPETRRKSIPHRLVPQHTPRATRKSVPTGSRTRELQRPIIGNIIFRPVIDTPHLVRARAQTTGSPEKQKPEKH